MGIVLDSDLVIRGERGHFALESWLVAHAQEEFYIAAVTVAELWHGVFRAEGERKTRREAYLTSIISATEVLPYTGHTAKIHARIWAALQSAGCMIGYYDLIIAAACIEHGLELATFNVRHFERIEGLTLIEIPSES